jgi:hypothetical protein
MPSIFYLNLLKLVDLTFNFHQRSPHEKDALVHEDNFAVEFLEISQIEPKILAFLVSGGGNLPKTWHPFRSHPLSNFELNFFTRECHQHRQQLHQISSKSVTMSITVFIY